MAKGHEVNRSELASFFGCSLNTVDNWVSRGCPYIEMADRSRGKQWRFNTADVSKWLQEQAVANAVGEISKLDLEEARRRKLAAEAAMAELELGREKGSLLDAEEVRKAGLASYTDCRNRFLIIPARLAPRLAAMKESHQIKKVLESEIFEALNELGNYSEPDPEDSGGVEKIPQAAGKA